MTHGGGGGPHGLLLEQMFELLDENQKRQLMVRMIEHRIKTKEHWVESMKQKIETYKMARDMLQAGIKK
ncbi:MULTISPECIES: hypothetical protein [Methanoculleus]|uniref:PH domain-containing protein n=1 Tax=Methanoculleus thermophilus TaxID=2200 RepID=A0A1G8XC46_9EURY|nr:MULTISPECIES: hypothetical protein [Methanoculleus]NLN09463.1 hypothetical protein [Methanoculleus thermophilus]SDJ88152.1 hypothetical protein SAMN04488571_101363 [Methanoculleus thermophilus]HQD25502.1 hypothetical protein [Methanoculleus thermophilus]